MFYFIYSPQRKKRRCAERGNKKAKYYSVAAILYRVRFRSLNIETRGKPAATSLCFNLFIHHRGKRGAALNEKAKGARLCSLLVARSPPLVTFHFNLSLFSFTFSQPKQAAFSGRYYVGQ
ncbi:hypothetical protein BG00_15615 [Pseudoalteromonas sp. SCSIO_11900]|nr:hypothetical protein BG00_15615 [Pseudoalteromonas sp. SCSIO_11900]